MNKRFSFFLSTLLFFILVNGFDITSNINSTLLVPLIVIAFGLVNKKILLNFAHLLSQRQTLLIFLLLSVWLLMSLFVLLAHGSYDLSYTRNIFSLMVSMLCCVFFVSCVFAMKRSDPPARLGRAVHYGGLIQSSNLNDKPSCEAGFHTQYERREARPLNYSSYIEKIIIHSFLLQSIIQILAFSQPSFASLVHVFYNDYNYKILYQDYGGIRGLALTGSPGWGLAVGYGLAFLFFTKHYFLGNKINLKSVAYGWILVLGAFFSGRSAFAGAIVSVFLFLFSFNSLLYKFRSAVHILLLLPIVSLNIFVFFDFYQQLYDRVFPFVFEAIYKYQSTGRLETGSTNVLINMWKISFSLDTFLFGDGFLIVDNHYYEHTDVGYLRNILFGGIFWCLFLWVLQFLFAFPIKKYQHFMLSNDRLLVFFCLLLCFIYEAKAMTLVYNKYEFIILMVYLLSFLGNTKIKSLS